MATNTFIIASVAGAAVVVIVCSKFALQVRDQRAADSGYSHMRGGIKGRDRDREEDHVTDRTQAAGVKEGTYFHHRTKGEAMGGIGPAVTRSSNFKKRNFFLDGLTVAPAAIH
jgi:hypothetical protein